MTWIICACSNLFPSRFAPFEECKFGLYSSKPRRRPCRSGEASDSCFVAVVCRRWSTFQIVREAMHEVDTSRENKLWLVWMLSLVQRIDESETGHMEWPSSTTVHTSVARKETVQQQRMWRHTSRWTMGGVYSRIKDTFKDEQKPFHYVISLVYRPTTVLLQSDMPWVRRAIRITNAYVGLVSANAYISTLGGGYFLCKYIPEAEQLAQFQVIVALGLGDPELASRCRINLAYNAIASGRFGVAQRIIRREKRFAKHLESETLWNVCLAAQVYTKKTYQLYVNVLAEQALDPQRPSSDGEDHLKDNYYRQRLASMKHRPRWKAFLH